MSARPASLPVYSNVAIALHWAIAAAIGSNLLLGFWMQEAIEVAGRQAAAVSAFQWHKSIGLTILALTLLRLIWRFTHRPPPPVAMPRWQQHAATLTHGLLYALMLALPLSGWLYVSTQWRHGAPLSVPTLWFGLFEVPHLFGLNEAATAVRRSWSANALNAHWLLAWGSVGLIGLHAGAALWHHFIKKDDTLRRMLPWPGQPRWAALSRSARGALTASLLLVLAGFGALAYGLLGASPAGKRDVQDAADIRSPSGNWQIVPADSFIRFSGTHAGSEFEGHFVRWAVMLDFDPDQPGRIALETKVQTDSATDGIPLHDSTLKEPEWFDVTRHPQSLYTADQIEAIGENHWTITGRLQIKDQVVAPVALDLKRADNGLLITGQTQLSREAANLGMESDPSGQWVSSNIGVAVRARFTPK